MSTTDFTDGLAGHFGWAEAEKAQKRAEATVLYWRFVASAADGKSAPTADQAQALGEAMELLGPSFTLEGFSKDVGELQKLRELRRRGDVEAATEEKERLREKWAEVSKRVVKAREFLPPSVTCTRGRRERRFHQSGTLTTTPDSSNRGTSFRNS